LLTQHTINLRRKQAVDFAFKGVEFKGPLTNAVQLCYNISNFFNEARGLNTPGRFFRLCFRSAAIEDISGQGGTVSIMNRDILPAGYLA